MNVQLSSWRALDPGAQAVGAAVSGRKTAEEETVVVAAAAAAGAAVAWFWSF